MAGVDHDGGGAEAAVSEGGGVIDRRDVIIGASLFAAALAIRLIFAARLVFPPLDDPAFYLQTARNLAAGRGLVIDVLWNYFVPFGTVTHPSHEFWMPLATLSMAASIKLLGDTLSAAQWPGLIGGALLPVLTYAMGRYLWPKQMRWATLAALLIVPGAVLVYQSASMDSAALYAVLSTGTLFTAAVSLERRSVKLSVVTGLLCGASYLTRSHGSVLPVGIGLIWVIALRRNRAILIKAMIGAAIGAGVFVIPWWLRNASTFGSIQPFLLLTSAAARDYGEWFNYGDLPSVEKLVAVGFGPLVQLRWEALLHDLGVIGLMTFPFGVIGLPVALLRREAIFRVFAAYGVLVWLIASLVFPVPSLTGSFYHSAGVFAPWAALGCVVVIKRLGERARVRRLSVIGYAAIVGLVIGQSTLAWPNVISDGRANHAKLDGVTHWLWANAPRDQPVVTNEAHSLNYASGYAALTLPNQQAVATLRQLAERYGARFVVVFGRTGLYPGALEQASGVVKRYDAEDVMIYELRPDSEI